MHLTEKEIEHLSKLAKVKLSDNEKKKLWCNMDDIISFLGALDDIKTEDLPPKIDDEKISCFETTEKFEDTDLLLKNSRHQKGDLISVQTAFQ